MVGGARGVWFPAIRTGGGADVFTERLAAELSKRGLRTQITWLPLRAEFAPWTVPVPRPPAWADVAHVNTWLPPRFLPVGIPVVATVHHCIHEPALQRYKGKLRRIYHEVWVASNERAISRRATVLTAVSAFAGSSAARVLGNKRVEVVHNGVDVDLFQPRQRLQRDRFRLLYVGKWSVLKGVDLFPAILSELGAGFEFCCAGPGSTDSRALSSTGVMVRDLGRLPTSEAVAKAMQEADVLVFPSRMEGFGLVVAEAMACGLPVVATRGSALTELVEDGVTGFLCSQDDAKSFAQAVRCLAIDDGLRIHMAERARRRAVERFSIEQMVEAYAQIYACCNRA
ncbi:glycosyltransferase family 4 protein [Fulvimonas yonginensis]|uniref:Glycosyltransferase family 4 protein n=1 Tax=Fulvimonas yonginensis TaxID=1495200 RepID=A0ABU8J9B1_9GAMM